jgi:hypothetical protein
LSKDLSCQNKLALLPFLKKDRKESPPKARTERKKPKKHDYLRIFFAKKQKQRSYDFLPLSGYDLMTCAHQDSPNKSSTPSDPPHTQNNITPTQTKPSIFYPPPSPSTSSSTMLLSHVVRYQAFREITKFIRNNNNNWDKSAPTPLVPQGKLRSPHRQDAK